MGSDTRRNFQGVCTHLNLFETKPKNIEGNQIQEWFIEGENLFKEFYKLGTSFNWNTTDIKSNQEVVKDIISRVSRNQGWLQSFITVYPGLRIDLEGATPAVDICQVRSGIELLLKGFRGINTNFDKVLNDLNNFGELEEFDDHLKEWKAGHRPDFFPEDRHANTPKSHWWWL